MPARLRAADWRILATRTVALGPCRLRSLDDVADALAIEHGLVLCSTDGDFERFAGLRWRNPVAS